MIALLLTLQAAAPAGVDGSPLGPIGRQQLPASGCAAYLWSAGDRHELVAMASAEPARLRLVIDGRPVDLPRAEGAGVASFGLSATTRYRADGVEATLDLTIAADPTLSQGATVPGATLLLARTGRDAVVVPVAGLVGCAAAGS